jgi:peptidoglycan/LPS O-acetylase OafA/YrhL
VNNRNHNIDILKMIAIVSVILLHSFPRDLLFLSGAPYHIWQTVPIFMILAGYNTANSYKRRSYNSLNQVYNFSFIYKKMERLIYPFLLVWLVQMVAQYVISEGLSINEIFISLLSGGWGPGSYFVPIIIQATLILPLIYFLCRKNLTVMTIFLFVLSIVFEFICLFIDLPGSIYRLLVIRYLFALTLGVWLALNKSKIKFKWLIPLAILSFVYITGVNYYEWVFIMEKFWLSQHSPSYFWSLILIILGLTVYRIKANNKISKLLVKIGQASYHIFLVQMVYFWAIANRLPDMSGVLYLAITLVFCLVIGLIYFEMENWIRKMYKSRLDEKRAIA